MDRFIRRENVRRFHDLLTLAKDETERKQILQLLAEEKQKQMEAGDPDDLEHQ
jgi:hypothetical protein